MPSAQDILQFHFSPTSLEQSAEKIIPRALVALIEHRIDILDKITEDTGKGSFIFTGDSLIPQIFRKFKSSIKEKKERFDRRELRTLTYSLSHTERNLDAIFYNETELAYALNILASNWRDSFLIGLIDCFLRNWETQHKKSQDSLEQFILNKLESYAGNRSTLLSFKLNRRFFSTKNGDLILGDTIAKNNDAIQEAYKILCVPDSWLAYPYFSKVIVTYYERRKDDIFMIIDNLNEILIQHNNSVTNKRLISKIIVQTNQPQFSGLQDKVKSIAFNLIGDPAIISKWSAFDTATEKEQVELKNARSILDEWIAKQFIDVFFRVCINDERRKNFWLEIASKNKISFKVYGPIRTKNILKKDHRIAEYVDARYERVHSNIDVSAFILYIGEYMLIEFSREGYAFYAYKINSLFKPNLSYQLNSVDDLRNGSMPMLVTSDSNYNYYSDEGRLTHRDGNEIWETKFFNWLNQKVLR